jgi:hypothetical protein
MAKNKLKKRVRKAVRKELQRREALRRPLGPDRGGWPNEPYTPRSEPDWPRWPDEDDPEGGAGVREPRRPWPTMPAAALELDEPEPEYLDLTR